MPGPRAELILASKSAARSKMLQNAGVDFKAQAAELDEKAIVSMLQQNGTGAADIAQKLADEKALAIAQEHPHALVIGSDQVLECEGKIFSKAGNGAEARENLKRLRGRAHRLYSAVSVAQDQKILWRHGDEARLSMHDFSDDFLEGYCRRAGEALTQCVGGYALEAEGTWLFSKVEGDYFTVLGMPLLPLLGYMQQNHGFGP